MYDSMSDVLGTAPIMTAAQNHEIFAQSITPNAATRVKVGS